MSINALATQPAKNVFPVPVPPHSSKPVDIAFILSHFGPSQSKMADAVAKIADLKNQIAEDTDRLVDIKVRIAHAIKAVDNTDLQLLLELRYLCYHTWEQIAIEMNCTVRNVQILHGKALERIKFI